MLTIATTELKRQTSGRWLEILEQAGIPGEFLDGRGHPCPRCGGTDRFSAFRDVSETGGVHCRHCFTDGADGFAAIAWLLDLSFPAVLNWVSDHLGRATKLQTARASLPRGESFASCHDAVAALDRFMARRHSAKRTGLWTYRRDGEPVAVVVRYDSDRKTYRPVTKHADGWRWSDPPGPWPLYGELPEELTTVYVVEGEKCADAARSIGLVGVTSAHGAGSAHKSDWSPLAGARRVVILPDHDQPGGRYAAEVESIVRGLGVRDVRTVDLPGLPPGGDIVDWRTGRDRADLIAELRDLVDGAEPEPPEPIDQPQRFEPFPTGQLPEPLRSFVRESAASIGCDESYLALPALAVCGAAIGCSRRVLLKSGWSEPPIIWALIVGESGTAKTPAFKEVLQPLREIEGDLIERQADEQRSYELARNDFDKAMRVWQKDGKRDSDQPERPEEPLAQRHLVSDATTEAMATILRDNTRGVLLARDELSGWLGSFNRYAGGKGGDEAVWLSMHNAESIIVDRKTGTPRTIHVRQAACSIAGGIQPQILQRAIGDTHRENGLLARFLLTCPPRKAKRWTEASPDEATTAGYRRLVRGLLALDMIEDESGRIGPRFIGLSRPAHLAWQAWYDHHAGDLAEASGDLAAALSKLEAYAARLALVFHCVRQVDGCELERAIGLESLESALAVVEWAKRETARVYDLLGETGDDRDERELVDWIRSQGGQVTERDLRRGPRKYRAGTAAEEMLTELVRNGLGTWEIRRSGKAGGRPTRLFQLATVATEPKP